MAGVKVLPGGEISLREMRPEDIPFGLSLSLAAGWNQTAADWALFLDLSSKGSYVASLGGVDAGTVTTVSYGNRLHWIGMVLVAEAFRRRGVGTVLLQAAIHVVKGEGVVCLDATPTGKPLYAGLGFREIYELARWLRLPAALAPVTCRSQPLFPEMLPAVEEYDRAIFGAERGAVLQALCRNAPELAWGIERAGRLRGYCLGRRGSRFTQIGPVCADSLEDAGDLLVSALVNCAQQPVIVDPTFHQPGWNRLLKALGFGEQRPFTRMALGDFVLPKRHIQQFAIAGPEIG